MMRIEASAVRATVRGAMPIVVRERGLQDYSKCWATMQSFTRDRDAATADEIWLVQHPPVFTLGLAGKPEHVLMAGDIPVVKTDRGGQVTYHGPGQAVVYVMCDLRRRGLAVRECVRLLEQSVIDELASLDITAARRAGAPGVYVDDAKIAALGLRVVRGCTYHGLALNVDMDLSPYSRINPCGYVGMRVTQMRDFGVTLTASAAAARVAARIQRLLEQQ